MVTLNRKIDLKNEGYFKAACSPISLLFSLAYTSNMLSLKLA